MPRAADLPSPSAISRKTPDWPIRCSSSPSRGAPRSSPVERPPERRLPVARLLAAVLLVATAACASRGPMRAAHEAERRSDFDSAVVAYTAALRAHPQNRTARIALQRVRLRASQEHYVRGRRLAAAERHEEAAVELQLAAELNPTDA